MDCTEKRWDDIEALAKIYLHRIAGLKPGAIGSVVPAALGGAGVFGVLWVLFQVLFHFQTFDGIH